MKSLKIKAIKLKDMVSDTIKEAVWRRRYAKKAMSLRPELDFNLAWTYSGQSYARNKGRSPVVQAHEDYLNWWKQ